MFDLLEATDLWRVLCQVEHLWVAIVLPLMINLVLLRLQVVDEIGSFDTVEVLEGRPCNPRLLHIDGASIESVISDTPSDGFVLVTLRLRLKVNSLPIGEVVANALTHINSPFHFKHF